MNNEVWLIKRPAKQERWNEFETNSQFGFNLNDRFQLELSDWMKMEW